MYFFFVLNIRQYFELYCIGNILSDIVLWYFDAAFLVQLVLSDDCAGFFQNYERDALLFLRV